MFGVFLWEDGEIAEVDQAYVKEGSLVVESISAYMEIPFDHYGALCSMIGMDVNDLDGVHASSTTALDQNAKLIRRSMEDPSTSREARAIVAMMADWSRQRPIAIWRVR